MSKSQPYVKVSYDPDTQTYTVIETMNISSWHYPEALLGKEWDSELYEQIIDLEDEYNIITVLKGD